MPAKSKSQQRFMGMVHAYQKGELKDAPKSIKKAAKSMTKKASKDFAETKHKGLPEKVSENNDFGPGFANRSLAELEQELEDLEREHQEAVLMGEDPEIMDDLENQIEQVQAWIEDKQRAAVNVGEAFRSLTFSKFLQLEASIPVKAGDVDKAALDLRVLVNQLGVLVKKEMEAQQQPRQQQSTLQQQRQKRGSAKKKTPTGLEKSLQQARQFGGPVRTEGVLGATSPSAARVAGGMLKHIPGAIARAAGSKIQQAAAASPFSQVFKSAAERYAEKLASSRAAKMEPIAKDAAPQQPASTETMPDAASALQTARGAARRPTQAAPQQTAKPKLSPSASTRAAQLAGTQQHQQQAAPQQSAPQQTAASVQGVVQNIVAAARNMPNGMSVINTAVEGVKQNKALGPAVAERVRQILQAELARGAKA